MQGRYIDADGVSTYVLETGEGPDLVLLHGGGIGVDAGLTWQQNIPALATRFHVTAFDQIGFGRTAMPRSPAAFTRVHRATHALAVLDALGITRAVLVGHSEGGLIASWIGVTHPERVGKLVIVASGATAPRLGGERDRPWVEAANTAYDWTLAASSEDNFVENFKRTMLFHPERAPETLLRENHRRALESGNSDLYLHLPDEEADLDLYYSMAEKHIHPHLGSLSAETLLVWANDDATVPVERGLALQALIPRADLHILDQAKHMLMIDQSAAFNRLLLGLV